MDETQTHKKLFVKDVVNLNTICFSKLNLLNTPVGTGKSTWALEILCDLPSHKHKMVYLIDTQAGRDKLLTHPNAMGYSDDWRNALSNKYAFLPSVEDKVVVMTYAKFGVLVLANNDFLPSLEAVACDEMDGVFWSVGSDRTELIKQYPHYSSEQIDWLLQKTSHVNATLNALKMLWRSGKCYVVAMTATPNKIYKRYGEEVYTIPLTCQLEGYQTNQTILYNNLSYELSLVEKGKPTLVYIPHVTTIKEQMEPLIRRGLDVGAVWSLDSEAHPVSAEQVKLRNYILQNQRLPDGMDVLFFNKSMERCVDIYGDITSVYIHSRDEDTITQARGRLRGDLQRLYVYGFGKGELIIPTQFLDRPLFTEDKDTLAEVLNIRTAGGRLAKWPTINMRLGNEGNFTVEDLPRENNRRSVIIHAQ